LGTAKPSTSRAHVVRDRAIAQQRTSPEQVEGLLAGSHLDRRWATSAGVDPTTVRWMMRGRLDEVREIPIGSEPGGTLAPISAMRAAAAAGGHRARDLAALMGASSCAEAR
jgi:hypothetical protein